MSVRRLAAARARLDVAASSLVVTTVACAAACGSTVPPSTGLLPEPIQVVNGQFFPGALPGPAADAVAPSGDDGGEAGGGSTMPLVTGTPAVGSNPLPIYNGEGNVDVAGGYVSPNAATIAVRFTDLGTGYWITPVGGVDSTMMFQRSFSFHANFSPSVPGGSHTLEFAAIDSAGNAGPSSDVDLCFAPSVPDYTTTPSKSHACRPDQPLPPLVISMKWDASFDVDLTVVLPDGNVVNPKQPNPELIEVEDAGGTASSVPFFDRDSLRGCANDGYRQEDLIFPTTPQSGQYLIYANPFAACGRPTTTFVATVYKAEGVCPTCGQVVQFTQAGQLLGTSSLANGTTGGASLGLFVGTYTYP